MLTISTTDNVAMTVPGVSQAFDYSGSIELPPDSAERTEWIAVNNINSLIFPERVSQTITLSIAKVLHECGKSPQNVRQPCMKAPAAIDLESRAPKEIIGRGHSW